MTVITLAEADREFLVAIDYYELREPGLGNRFRNEVAETVAWISQNVEAPRLRRRGYRRVNLQIFPHYVAYVVRDGQIWIVAIANAFRRPEFWISRI